ncbi:MAG: VOC family protein [Bacteroidetes bacterium]|nr:VOC family protein [Bacteroidota bacterium]
MAAAFNTYLNFPGNTEEAFNFYKSVFGGEFLTIMRFKDTPGCDGMPAPDQNKIMHIALPVGKGSVLMATDAVEGMGQPLKVGNNVSISLTPDSEAEGKKLFDGLGAGGTVLVPYDKAFWGATFGMLVDKFGIQWMVNYDERQPQ